MYPFRAGARGPVLRLALLPILLPFTFPLVLGYGLDAVEASVASADAPPPAFAPNWRMVRRGSLAAFGFLVLSAPFIAGVIVVAEALRAAHRYTDTGFAALDAFQVHGYAAALVAFPWGAVMLLVLLPNLAVFARSGRLRDLVNPAAAGRRVRRHFVAWNVAGVATVTAWALAVASTLACGAGGLLGFAYAILVTAHAAAAIEAEA